MPTLRPVPPEARKRRSRSTTRRTPSPASWNAIETPVTPPPTMTTSAVPVIARAGAGSARHAEGGGLPLRIVGRVEAVSDAPQHLAGGRFPPEPAGDLVASGVGRPGEIGLEIERLDVVGAPPDERRQRDVRRPVGHVGVVPGGKALEEPRDVLEPVGRHAAQPERGATAALAEPRR